MSAKYAPERRVRGLIVSDAGSVQDDNERFAYEVRRLFEGLEHPLNTPGSENLVALGLSQYDDPERLALVGQWIRKVRETLDDGESHSILVLTGGKLNMAMLFVAWPGTVYEVQPQRVGEYLDALVGAARHAAGLGLPLEGFLEIDAYVREWPDDEAPGGQSLAIDTEYSYLPGVVFGGVETTHPDLNVMLINDALCTAEERQTLAEFRA